MFNLFMYLANNNVDLGSGKDSTAFEVEGKIILCTSEKGKYSEVLLVDPTATVTNVHDDLHYIHMCKLEPFTTTDELCEVFMDDINFCDNTVAFARIDLWIKKIESSLKPNRHLKKWANLYELVIATREGISQYVIEKGDIYGIDTHSDNYGYVNDTLIFYDCIEYDYNEC